MARWRNKAIENLLKYSKEKKDHTIAAKEWCFSGNVVDHFISNQICQLCEGENLRYHFEILRDNPDKLSLFVGSSCIKKFDISVFDDKGKEVFGTEKNTFLKKKIEEKKQELLLEQLRLLWSKSNTDEREEIEYYVHNYKRKNGFNPEELCFLFSLMGNYQIEFTPILYKVSLRSQFELQSLRNMTEKERDMILPCLSVAQKKRFSKKKEEDIQQKKREASLAQTEKKGETILVNSSSSQLYSNNRYFKPTVIPKRPPKKYNIKSSRNQQKPKDIFHLPEYITCSICGKYTKEWVSFNPHQCRNCVGKERK